MTAADEYQRVLDEHRPDWDPRHRRRTCTCGQGYRGVPDDVTAWPAHAAHVAQALAADPGVRAAVEREARAEAWDEGHERCSCNEYDDMDCCNPYRQEPGDGE